METGAQNQNEGDLVSELVRTIDQFREECLEPGGPEVDYLLLAAYVDGDLDQLADGGRSKEVIAQAISRWRNWFDAYIGTRSAVNNVMKYVDSTESDGVKAWNPKS